ncbi:valine--tRNA ligase, mitochondrial isoform X1 [Nasonia vitripennis]|uniref:valine--tRNA ligase n=1 Tax=Nasonia vitripennis TaxID=7425 RepID=A0A7M7QNL2_NASVI|nr:valine--tRNA ligase, mitochondrial isoform X1 [Nasonia vitripennis]XP_031789447.1 valine--tRNA ligase, mitochondrial isoform X1 [Nasonia vitripennis]
MYMNRARDYTNIKLIGRKCHNIYHNHRLNDFPLTFQSKDVEKGWYEVWERNKYFQPNDKKEKSYRMILPPPNVTGTLHLGHALTTTVQDVLARWHRMRGYSVLWVPGLDHAGIATQAVVEKYLYKTKGLKRTDMSKNEFLDLLNQWKEKKSSTIENQLKTLGASLDWSREYFTMSKHHSQAVTEALIMLDQRNLLYRDKSLVNWSTALGSALSDIEVEFEKITTKTDLEIPGYDRKVTFGQIYEISYDLRNSSETLKVATTRPETLLGDVALAVHPDDDRYSQFIGQQVKHPLKDSYLPVIADASVKMDFGTGIVKITPAHDHFDYTIAKKHNLKIIDIINEDGKLNDAAGHYKGFPRFIARKKILADLANLGSLASVKDHEMEIPRCSRTGDIIELLLKEQWFIRCKDMAARALQAVENESLKFDPPFHNKTWFDWLTTSSVRDWCVSRQLWWGHQIPAYHCKVNNEIKWIIARSKIEALQIAIKKYGDDVKVEQDNDVLDTWFSSALLPFSSLGWPTKATDFQKYYPLSLMETGHDILFFWVARMVMLGLELTNELPFKEVLLHGVLCDAQGKKMSKSRGNVIYPENVVDGISLENLNEQAKKSFEDGILSQAEIKRTLAINTKMFPNGVPECGVDALRYTLCSHNIKERTVSFNIIECQQNKFFCNKIWQASRYVVLMTSDDPIEIPKNFAIIDQWILSRLGWMVETVNNAFDQKNFYKAVNAIKEFIYYEFCDYYMEGTKPGFKSEQQDIIISHRYTLAKCLEVSLRILAPITPYLSDELYSKLSEKLSIFEFNNSLLESTYPTKEEFVNLRDHDLETKMHDVIKVILSIRTLLANVSKKDNVEGFIVVNNSGDLKLYQESINIITAVSKLFDIKVIPAESYVKNERSISDNFELNCSVCLKINDDSILKLATERIEKKRIKTQKKLQDLIKSISNKKYSSSSSEEEKLKDQEKLSHLQGELKRIPVST